MKKNRFLPGALALVLALTALSLAGCAASDPPRMVDGYYTAEMSAFTHGWKEYVTICVNGGGIKSVEFNAVNPSGFIKAWDMAYMRSMSAAQGMYPNRYTRAYAKQLMEKQSADGIDTVSGATVSGGNFRLLADAVVQMAMRGDDDIAVVDAPAEAQPASAQAAATPTSTPAPTPTPMPTPTPTPMPTPTPTPSPAPSPAPAIIPTATPTATPTVTVQPVAAPTVKPIVTARHTAAPTPTPVPTPAPTPRPALTADAVSGATVPKTNP